MSVVLVLILSCTALGIASPTLGRHVSLSVLGLAVLGAAAYYLLTRLM